MTFVGRIAWALPAALLAGTILLQAGAALAAEQPAPCEGYVKTTLRQQVAAKRLGCAVSGRQWSASQAELEAFCTSSEPPVRRAALLERRAAVQACAAEKKATREAARTPAAPAGPTAPAQRTADSAPAAGPAASCAGYVRRTLRQQAVAKSLGCAVSGEAWTAGEAELAAACAAAEPPARRAALLERRETVRACATQKREARAAARGKPTGRVAALNPAATPGRCRSYVAATLRQQAAAWQLGCAVTGERWASSARQLAASCKGAEAPALRAELVAGRQAIKACADGRKETPANPADARNKG